MEKTKIPVAVCVPLKVPFYLIIASSLIALLSQTWILYPYRCKWKWIFINSFDGCFRFAWNAEKKEKEDKFFSCIPLKFTFCFTALKNDQKT